MNNTTPPDLSIPNNTDLPESLIESNTNGYIAAIVGAGIGIPILLSTSCLENRNVADSFETLIELIYEKVLEREYGDWRTPVMGSSEHEMFAVDTEIPWKSFIEMLQIS